MIILEATKEELAEAEIKALGDVKKEGNLFLAKEYPYSRPASVNRAFKITLPKAVPKNKTFKLEAINTTKDFSVIQTLQKKGATINLKHPDNIFAQIKFKNNVYFCEQVYNNKKEFLQRHPKFRPGFHPGACTPKLAKILVNLSGVQTRTIIDPFCGTGGICIEAAFMGINAKGYDIEQSMIEKATLNADHYEKKISFKKQDALKLNKTCDAIVTELPFGKTTKLATKLPELVEAFLENAKKCTKKIVLVLSSNHGCTFSWRVVYNHTHYIHKSLSKEIFVLEHT